MEPRDTHRDDNGRLRRDEGRVPPAVAADPRMTGAERHGAELSDYERRDEGVEAGRRPSALLTPEATTEYRREWEEIKASFVDDPESAVARVEKLTQSALDEAFGRLRRECDELRDTPSEPSTEELRARLHRYHAILGRLGAD